MTSVRAARAEPISALPPPGWWPLFGCALSALLVLWLPLALLQEIDALLAFVEPVELWHDVALLLPMVAAAGLALAMLARLGSVCASVLGMAPGTQRRIAWALLLVPTGWLCAWQVTRSVRLWLQITSGIELGVGAHTRIIGIALLLALMLAVWWRYGAANAGRKAIQMLLALRGPAFALLATGVLTLALSPPNWHPGPAERPAPVGAAGSAPDILLISIDSLAAEDAAVCGSGPTPMPHLRALVQQSTCFTRLYAASNFTTPTTSTIETGVLPWTHFAGQIAAKVLPPLREQTLSGHLRAAGYRTHFVTDNFLASPRHHGTWRGYDSDRYAASGLLRNRLREALTVFADSQLPLLVDNIISFIGALDTYLHAGTNPYVSDHVYAPVPGLVGRADGPAFVWVHTMPPHAPYLPLPGFKHQLLPAGELERWHEMLQENVPYARKAQALVDKHRLRYRESIMGADEALGRLLRELGQRGLLDRMLVVVTADHGESFERQFIGHAGPLLHDAVVRIPLVIKLPGQRAGRLVDQPVSQADIAPTLLALAGAAALPRAEGRSLASSLKGEDLPDAPVLAMTLERQSRFHPLREGRFAVIEGSRKMVWRAVDDSVELYDLHQDPREQRNLAAAEPDTVQRLRALIKARMDGAERQRRAWVESGR